MQFLSKAKKEII